MEEVEEREEMYEDPALAYESESGRWAIEVCRLYFDTKRASVEQDKEGTDAFWGAKSVQIKADRKMKTYGNFYKETEEKTYAYQPWRPSPNNAEIEIHVDDGYMVIATREDIQETIDRLGLKSELRSEKSKAYLIPLAELPHNRRVHGMTYPNVDADPTKLF